MRKNTDLLLLLLTSLLLVAVTALSQSRPPTPYFDKGACPFECCVYRQWTVEKPTIVRTAMRDSAPVAFRLKRGERGRGLTGTVITTNPGIAEVVKPIDEANLKLRSGERVYLLTDLGEGYMSAWYKGRTFAAEVFDPELFKTIRQPTSIWWVKVRNRAGKIGWSRQPENFGNMDECGG